VQRDRAKPATPPAAKKPATPKSKPATPAAGKLGEQAAAAAAAEPAVWTCVRALEVREPGLPTSAVASIVTHEGKLYVGSRDHRIRCYAMDTWALLATIEQPEAVTTLHVHRMDGYADCLISGCIDHCIRVWSLADLSLQCTLIGHTNGASTQHTRTATPRRRPDARVPMFLLYPGPADYHARAHCHAPRVTREVQSCAHAHRFTLYSRHLARCANPKVSLKAGSCKRI
jgi:hypothetical protein